MRGSALVSGQNQYKYSWTEAPGASQRPLWLESWAQHLPHSVAQPIIPQHSTSGPGFQPQAPESQGADCPAYHPLPYSALRTWTEMVKPLPVPKGTRGPGELCAQILAPPPSRGTEAFRLFCVSLA